MIKVSLFWCEEAQEYRFASPAAAMCCTNGTKNFWV